MLQPQDTYDGTLVAELETLAEMVRNQGAAEVMKAHTTELIIEPYECEEDRCRRLGKPYPPPIVKPPCPACTEGLIRLIRDNDTVMHVNGDLCKRFHP